MLDLDSPEVIAVEAAAGFAQRSRDDIKIVSDAWYLYSDANGAYYNVPVHVQNGESYRVGDIIVIVDPFLPTGVFSVFLR
jgi:hypothetical protein